MSEQRIFQHDVTREIRVVSKDSPFAKEFDKGSTCVDVAEYDEVKVAPLDAVVIDGPLPEVTACGSTLEVGGNVSGYTTDDADLHDRIARRHAAIAAHLRARPPVDQEQVEALTEVLRADFADRDERVYYPPEVRARRLVQRGVRVEGGAS